MESTETESTEMRSMVTESAETESAETPRAEMDEVLASRELLCIPMSVVRSIYRKHPDGNRLISRIRSRAVGCVQPGTPETAKLLPEEEQLEEFAVIYTTFPLQCGANEGATWKAADRVEAGGDRWRVVQVSRWGDVTRAAAVLVRGYGNAAYE